MEWADSRARASSVVMVWAEPLGDRRSSSELTVRMDVVGESWGVGASRGGDERRCADRVEVGAVANGSGNSLSLITKFDVTVNWRRRVLEISGPFAGLATSLCAWASLSRLGLGDDDDSTASATLKSFIG